MHTLPQRSACLDLDGHQTLPNVNVGRCVGEWWHMGSLFPSMLSRLADAPQRRDAWNRALPRSFTWAAVAYRLGFRGSTPAVSFCHSGGWVLVRTVGQPQHYEFASKHHESPDGRSARADGGVSLRVRGRLHGVLASRTMWRLEKLGHGDGAASELVGCGWIVESCGPAWHDFDHNAAATASATMAATPDLCVRAQRRRRNQCQSLMAYSGRPDIPFE